MELKGRTRGGSQGGGQVRSKKVWGTEAGRALAASHTQGPGSISNCGKKKVMENKYMSLNKVSKNPHSRARE